MTRLYDDLGVALSSTEGRTVRFERNPTEEYEQQAIARSINYVHCWFSGHSSSDYMWREYGHNGTGVCIESSSRALLGAIRKPSNVETIRCGGVTYSDGSQAIATLVSDIPFFHKHNRFANEKEIRLVACLAYDRTTLQYDNSFDRLTLPVTLDSLIRKVVLGCHVSHDKESEIVGLISGLSLNCSVERRSS